MNCKDFEKIVIEHVRGPMIDAVIREQCKAHVEVCTVCAARLANERELEAGLKALAASDEDKIAPARLENILLADFRSRPSISHNLTVTSKWSRLAYAAAALLILTLGLIVYGAFRNQSTNRPFVITTPPAILPPTPLQPQKNDKEGSSVSDKVVVKEALSQSRERRSSDRQLQKVAIHRNRDTQRQRVLIRDGMTLYASDSEITTDFLLLNSSGNLTPMERGQLIRVQMPRTTLVSFGLPMNAERSNIPVKADLLIGEDGLARAIRFVR